MEKLDLQMKQWSSRLRDDLKVDPLSSNQLATAISNEMKSRSESLQKELRAISPVSFHDRLDELTAFQDWMDFARANSERPAIVRAQVITQNYVCFVYLGDAWFKKLRSEFGPETVTKKCCRFLTDNPVRAFRNALAHANWKYKKDFSGLEFWSRKGSDPKEPMHRFEVSQSDLAFWQSLARCTAYASFLGLDGS